MTLVRAGQPAAMERLVRRYERELFLYLKRYLGEANLAEDVFQNTFLQVFVKRHAYNQEKRFKPWLYAIATNQAIDALRRIGRRPWTSLENVAPRPDGGCVASAEIGETVFGSPLDGAAREEMRERVRVSVQTLPDHLRSVVLLAYFQGMRYRDIADTLEIPVGTVKSRLFTAVRQLQQHWSADILNRQGGEHHG